ncbi:MAG: hypothetical protein M3Y30_03055 [Gemmatimonadota bacterium]|nr:hypothetical protein [Gemmatimonadota bacterium]
MLAYLAYIALRALNDYEYWTIVSGLTLVVHEAGHVIFSPFGEMLEVAGGSITQIAIPIVVAMLFLRQREYFGISVALAWLSMSLTNLATYIGDARTQFLGLVSMGNGDPIHDWHFILARYAMLGDDRALARFANLLSVLALVAAVLLGAWLCNAMRKSAGETPPADEGIASGLLS